MNIWIDADGCPVVHLTESIAKEFDIPLFVVKNIHHFIELDYGKVYTVDSGSDQADFFIANKLLKSDLVITQDYGLAAMAIAKGAVAINQFGSLIDQTNIDQHLDRRHFNKELRKQTGKSTKFKKRSPEDDLRFAQTLKTFIMNQLKL